MPVRSLFAPVRLSDEGLFFPVSDFNNQQPSHYPPLSVAYSPHARPLLAYRSQAFWCIIRAVPKLTKRTSARNRCVSGPCPHACASDSIGRSRRKEAPESCLSVRLTARIQNRLFSVPARFQTASQTKCCFLPVFRSRIGRPFTIRHYSISTRPLLANHTCAISCKITAANMKRTVNMRDELPALAEPARPVSPGDAAAGYHRTFAGRPSFHILLGIIVPCPNNRKNDLQESEHKCHHTKRLQTRHEPLHPVSIVFFQYSFPCSFRETTRNEANQEETMRSEIIGFQPVLQGLKNPPQLFWYSSVFARECSRRKDKL